MKPLQTQINIFKFDLAALDIIFFFLKNANSAVMYKRPPGIDLIPVSIQYAHMNYFTFLF